MRLLDEKQVAADFGLTAWTLQKWRQTGDGPPFLRVGPRSVRYDPDKLREWLAGREKVNTAEVREVGKRRR